MPNMSKREPEKTILATKKVDEPAENSQDAQTIQHPIMTAD
jgi:hypothetical protein